MNKIKVISVIILITFQIQGCSTILETVSLDISKTILSETEIQEEFDIKIKSLNFDTAKIANKSPYSRQLMIVGSGSKANVFNETDFLSAKLPTTHTKSDYLIGIEDELIFTRLNDFIINDTKWPTFTEQSDYKIGVGDELTMVQVNDGKSTISIDPKGINSKLGEISEKIISSASVVDNNGNILFLGMGSIKALNKTLETVRTDIRNTLIRNGLAPNFQLEITKFQSQKAIIDINDAKNRIIYVNNIPRTLKELILTADVTSTAESSTVISLTRSGPGKNIQTFEISYNQLFNNDTPDIYIKDNDIIKIKSIKELATINRAVVGSKGNILLPQVGNIYVENQTLDEVYKKIEKIIINNGYIPNFQIEIMKFASQKAYLIQKNIGNKVIPLTSSKITLRDLILNNENPITSKNALALITLKRNNEVFHVTGEQILDLDTPDIWIENGDQIEIEQLSYKRGQVFALSGAGGASIITIDPSERENLAEILFVPGGALRNVLAKRSEVYLLRGQKSPIAYHLDAQNVSRILVAAKTELRPNDIIYVAERPIVSFTRTLSEIAPLRTLLRDLEQGNIP
jgi:protein involved in polysaccharide export with SLBB domain